MTQPWDHILIFPPLLTNFSRYTLICRGGWRAQVYLLSLPESEVLPQEQSELRQETHYGLSWQYPAKASLWQLAHLINPGGNKRQSLVLIQRSNASWGSATNHSLPQALGLMVQHLF